MMGRQEREMVGRDVLSGTSFIGTTSDSVTIHFPRKMCLSVSTTRAIWTRNRGAKRGSLKDFEVHSVLKKEPLYNR
jgi:hypothetical protein